MRYRLSITSRDIGLLVVLVSGAGCIIDLNEKFPRRVAQSAGDPNSDNDVGDPIGDNAGGDSGQSDPTTGDAMGDAGSGDPLFVDRYEPCRQGTCRDGLVCMPAVDNAGGSILGGPMCLSGCDSVAGCDVDEYCEDSGFLVGFNAAPNSHFCWPNTPENDHLNACLRRVTAYPGNGGCPDVAKPPPNQASPRFSCQPELSGLAGLCAEACDPLSTAIDTCADSEHDCYAGPLQLMVTYDGNNYGPTPCTKATETLDCDSSSHFSCRFTRRSPGAQPEELCVRPSGACGLAATRVRDFDAGEWDAFRENGLSSSTPYWCNTVSLAPYFCPQNDQGTALTTCEPSRFLLPATPPDDHPDGLPCEGDADCLLVGGTCLESATLGYKICATPAGGCVTYCESEKGGDAGNAEYICPSDETCGIPPLYGSSSSWETTWPWGFIISYQGGAPYPCTSNLTCSSLGDGSRCVHTDNTTTMGICAVPRMVCYVP